ncbi:MAG: hypothetical protein ABSH22_16145, partial [Tepidisphaeraceae bacterium]
MADQRLGGRFLGLAACAAAIFVLGAAPATQPAAAPVPGLQETQLGPLQQPIISLVYTPDGWHMAYYTTHDDKSRAIVDGEPQSLYEVITNGSLIFSPDAKHSAYAAADKDKHFVVLD